MRGVLGYGQAASGATVAPSSTGWYEKEGAVKRLQIRLLGEFCVHIGSHAIPEAGWRRRKAADLIKLLALAPGQRLHREGLSELLWPELEPEAATNNLHRTLHYARRLLEPHLGPSRRPSYLCLQGEVLVLSPLAPVWTDVGAFWAAAAEARRARHPAAYEEALGLYTGELLPHDRYEDWATGPREALQALYLELLLELAALHRERGDLALAIAALRRAVLAEPAHEEASAGLMRLYASTGQRHQALRQYQALKEALRHSLDAEPEASVRHLYEEILAGRFPGERPYEHVPTAAGDEAVNAAPAARPPDPPPTNLPGSLPRLIGREEEMAELKGLLEASRLLTLTGPGGGGKTRLALELAHALQASFPDGVWLVELAAVAEPKLVAQAVGTVLSLAEMPGRPLLEALCERLRSRRMLLVLDNCEHLVAASASLSQRLLGACPRLRLLATSREALFLPGEIAWRVPPLPAPKPSRLPPLASLPEYGAVALFLERARLSRPGFSLTPQNAAAVAQVCYQLDGLPLAVELAAARVNVMSVEQIAERLGDCLRLLAHRGQPAQPHHRSLRAALDWSYDLLAEEEQRFFRQLSVFAGGWTLVAAEAVCEGEAEVVDLLSRLVDKSLVVMAEQHGQARYRLLEPLRQYGAMRLREKGEEERVRARHLDWSLTLAESAEPELSGPEQAALLERLELEHDNLRAALGWALERGEAEAGLRLAGALWRFWHRRGHLGEGAQWLERALELSGAGAKARAKALRGAGNLIYYLGDPNRATARYEAALALYREMGDDRGTAAVLGHLAMVAHYQGAQRRAAALYEEALNLQRAVGDPKGAASTLHNLGNLAYDQGDYEGAVSLWEEALAAFRKLGEVRSVAGLLDNLGVIACTKGGYGRARTLFQESLALRRRLGDKVGMAGGLQNLGMLAHYQGGGEEAERLYTEALALSRELGDRWNVAAALGSLGGLARQRGDLARAAALGEESLSLHRELDYKNGTAASLELLAGVAADSSDLSRAALLLAESLTLYSEVADKLGIAACLEGCATVAGARGRARQAARLLGAAALLRAGVGEVLAPPDKADLEHRTDAVRLKLGHKAYGAAWKAGRALPLERAIAEALVVVEPVTLEAAPSAPPLQDITAPLTRREREIAALITQGLTDRQIASTLGMSGRTASTHISNLLRKLKLTSRGQVGAWINYNHENEVDAETPPRKPV